MVMMKLCSSCDKLKPTTEFYKQARMSDGLQPQCKTCANASYTKSRQKKSEHYRLTAKSKRDERRAKYDAWKQQQKCCVCNENDVDCLDLHHIDPAAKDIAVGQVIRVWSWERLQREIQKCVVLCANCHRKLHKGKITLRGVAQSG